MMFVLANISKPKVLIEICSNSQIGANDKVLLITIGLMLIKHK